MMAQITGEMITKLREHTGVGIAKCKEALVLAQGDHEEAINILRKQGMGAGAKKADREAKEGSVYVAEDASTIVMIEGNAETDFVANNQMFKDFLRDIAEQALKTKPATLEELVAQIYHKDKSVTVEAKRNIVIQTLGENILLRKLQLIHKRPNSSYGYYSHMGGKLVVLVEIEGATDQAALCKDVAMHAAAASPEYIRPEEVPAQILAQEEEIVRTQVKDKPPAVLDKIVQGKIKAYCDQVCLNNQKYIKDDSMTVQQFVEKQGKSLSIRCFWRMKVGQ
jgi:elongation factor Ts